MRHVGIGRLLASAGCVAAMLAAGLAMAQTPPGARPTNLAGVTTSAAPPSGFDAVNASDTDLATYGFPPRPKPGDALGLATWAAALGANPTRLMPRLQKTEVYHGASLGLRLKNTGDATSENWSGYAADNGNATWIGSSYATVAGDIIVPAAAARSCNATWDYSSVWVGIDGYASSDVLQAGLEADAICSNGSTTTYYSPWYEWYPSASVRITNLAATPGQSFYVHVWATSATAGNAYLQNLSTSQAVSLTFNAPGGTKLRGESAEWILEAPTVGVSEATLPNYGLAFMANASAATKNGANSKPSGAAAIAVTMSVNSVIYSSVGPLGPAGILFTSE